MCSAAQVHAAIHVCTCVCQEDRAHPPPTHQGHLQSCLDLPQEDSGPTRVSRLVTTEVGQSTNFVVPFLFFFFLVELIEENLRTPKTPLKPWAVWPPDTALSCNQPHLTTSFPPHLPGKPLLSSLPVPSGHSGNTAGPRLLQPLGWVPTGSTLAACHLHCVPATCQAPHYGVVAMQFTLH